MYIRDPANSGIFLLIDQSDQPKANALADWRQQAANRQGTYPGYHLILLQSVRYPQAEQAADYSPTQPHSTTTPPPSPTLYFTRSRADRTDHVRLS